MVKKTQKAWDWIHTIFQNAITRLLTVCVARTNRLRNHAQISKCSGRSKFFQWQRASVCILCSRGEGREKTPNRLARSLRSPPAPSPHCSLTLLLWVSTKCITTERWVVCVSVWTDSKVCTVSAGHTGIHTNTGGGCDLKLLKSTKSTSAAEHSTKNVYFFLQTNRNQDINILTVCPCQAWDLNYFYSIYFLFSLQKFGAQAWKLLWCNWAYFPLSVSVWTLYYWLHPLFQRY